MDKYLGDEKAGEDKSQKDNFSDSDFVFMTEQQLSRAHRRFKCE